MFDPQHRNRKLIGKPWTWSDVERAREKAAEGARLGYTDMDARMRSGRVLPEPAEGFQWQWVDNMFHSAGEGGFLEVNDGAKEIGRYVGCVIA